MQGIQNYIKESRHQEVENLLNSIIKSLEKESLFVEFGTIGVRTTYAMIYDKNHDIEIVGYTFLKDMKFYKENVGKLKALQQAIARKSIIDEA